MLFVVYRARNTAFLTISAKDLFSTKLSLIILQATNTKNVFGSKIQKK